MIRIPRSDWETAEFPRLGLLCFDGFQLDVTSGELCVGGTRIVLQPQPFKVLALLAACSGQAITREQIRRQLWSAETFVDFEGGLNFCIRQIRKALGEDARKPRYIETLHRRGYRFMAPVTRIDDAGKNQVPSAKSSPPPTCQPRPITLAVLPFTDLSCSFRQDFLADGITELLITYLSTDPSLRVVSRTTSMRYKGTDKSLPSIGRELAVDWVLEGAVLHSGARVQIAARLIDTSTDQNQWAACYEAEMRDRLALQNHVACLVSRDTMVHLLPRQRSDALLEFSNGVPRESRTKTVHRVWHLPIGAGRVRRVGESPETVPVLIAAGSRHAQPTARVAPRPRI
jgi:TolB-like protein